MLMKAVPALFEHSDKNVRAEVGHECCFEQTVYIYMYVTYMYDRINELMLSLSRQSHWPLSCSAGSE